MTRAGLLRTLGRMDEELESWDGETHSITLDPATFASIRAYWTHGKGAG